MRTYTKKLKNVMMLVKLSTFASVVVPNEKIHGVCNNIYFGIKNFPTKTSTHPMCVKSVEKYVEITGDFQLKFVSISQVMVNGI